MDEYVNETVHGLSYYHSDDELAAVVLFPDYPEPLLRFASVCCVLYMLIGIPGNLITIVALAKCKKVRNATAIFIINLSLSDLLFSCFILPLAASTFWNRSWTHGRTLCHMFPLARYALVAVSLFTVLAITINRYVMISHPRLYPTLYTKKYLYLMIASIWLFSFGALIPTSLEVWGRFSLDHITGSCTIVPDENGATPKKLLFAIAFLLPSLAIILCYARILWIVRKTAKKSRSRPSKEMKSLNMSTTTIETVHLDKRRPYTAHFPMNCFIQTGAELSSSCESSVQEDPEKQVSTPEIKARTLGNEPRNFRQSFVATMRWTTTPKPRLPTKKDKKLLTMIVAIMVSFCICHLPITLAKTIFLEYTSHPVANVVGYALIYITTCVNPVIYVVLSSEYRQAYKNLIKCGR
ncbi:G-protein coupled receptor moody-like [Trichoplusia ni]|uniref:G-protein coupled receptor moody-like n=1 Tax=Trichoplusia ni TaxID=7111 RepID=A0A7E5VSB0_TRINI|nr:G-protein coupled receptor moody-like [Trichoplusia ni]